MSEHTPYTFTAEMAEVIITKGEEAQRNRIANLQTELANCTNQATQTRLQGEIADAEEIIQKLGTEIRKQIGTAL